MPQQAAIQSTQPIASRVAEASFQGVVGPTSYVPAFGSGRMAGVNYGRFGALLPSVGPLPVTRAEGHLPSVDHPLSSVRCRPLLGGWRTGVCAGPTVIGGVVGHLLTAFGAGPPLSELRSAHAVP